MVFKKSKANKEEAKTIAPWVSGIRKKLIDSKILAEENNIYTFPEDYIFNSPSASAATVLGRTANGCTQWKNKEGKPLMNFTELN